MLFNTRKLKKPGLSANRPSNNWALVSILLRRRIKKYPDFASTRFWIHRVFKTLTLESGFKKLRTRMPDSPDTCGRKLLVADSKISGYVWTGP